jgi:pre-mRNA-splicing factor ATP-dependent RNA helicase DHX38/PRP16
MSSSTKLTYFSQWLAELGGVFYSVKEKGYSQRDRRVTEIEFNKRMEIEEQMAADRERAAAEKLREQERNDPARRRREIEVRRA